MTAWGKPPIKIPQRISPPPFDFRRYIITPAAVNNQMLVNTNAAMTIISMTLQVSSDCTIQLFEDELPITSAYALKAGTVWSTLSRYLKNNSRLFLSVSSGTVAVEIVWTAGIVPGELHNTENRFFFSSIPTTLQGRLLPFGYVAQTAGVDATNGAANLAFIQPFDFYGYINFTRVSVFVDLTSNGNKQFVAIYRLSNLALVAQAAFTLTAATGVYTTTIAKATLNPDSYLLAWGNDNGISILLGYQALGTKAQSLINTSQKLTGNKPGVIVAGLFPSVLPALATFTVAVNNVPIVLIEP